jgi:phosphoglycolate phosphatase
LISTAPLLIAEATSSKGRKALPAQLIVRFIGDGARTLIARAADLPEASSEVDELLELFLAYYTAHPIDFTRWMEGAPDVLDALSAMPDMALAICTNKARRATDVVLAALGIGDRLRATFAGGDLPEKKPSPEPLLHLARLMGVPPGAVVMVGDGPQDVESARRAGMRSVAIEGGLCSLDRVIAAGPDVLLHSLVELPEIIGRWRDATARMTTPRRPAPILP